MRIYALSIACPLLLAATSAVADCAAVSAAQKKMSIDAASTLAISTLKASVGQERYRNYGLVGLAFNHKHRIWRMIFNDMTGAIDADPRVWIEEGTGQTCIAVGLDSHCMGKMYPRSLPEMDDDLYCKFATPLH